MNVKISPSAECNFYIAKTPLSAIEYGKKAGHGVKNPPSAFVSNSLHPNFIFYQYIPVKIVISYTLSIKP